MRDRRGFTLVEILIVVVLLAILAMIVLPKFTNMTTDAYEAALATDLQTTRIRIGLYKGEHSDCYPGQQDPDDPRSVNGDDFVADLLSKTDANGAPGGSLGPYFHAFPANPYKNNDQTVKVGTGDDLGDESATEGWYFNVITGKFSPNDPDHCGL